MPNPENLIGKGFESRPQNINKTGANRRSFASINNDLKRKGVKPLTKHDLIDAYALIFNSTDEELDKIKDDKKSPYVLRIIIKELTGPGRGKALADYRDYVFGKASEHIEHTIKPLSREDREKRIDALMKVTKRKAS